jgi:hypothetical protein
MEDFDTSTFFQDVEDLPLLVSEVGEKWQQLSLLKSTPTVIPFCPTTGPTSPSTPTSGTTTQAQGNLTLLPLVSPAPAPVELEPKQASTIPNQPSFGKCYASLPNAIPHLSSLSNPWELSIEALEQSLGDSEWSAIKVKLRLSRRRSLERDTAGKDCLFFPTPTACLGTYRQAGSNKLEQWLRSNGLIPNGSQLSATAYALIQGYPSHWFQALAPNSALSPPEPPAELRPASWPAEPLPQGKPALPLTESSTSIPSPPATRVKYKLEWPPRGVHPRRTRGQGSGYIQLHYCEKQTRSGKKSYEQYYYHYELEIKGKRVKRSAYIPKDKLDVVQEWDRKKLDVTVILQYLGKAM